MRVLLWSSSKLHLGVKFVTRIEILNPQPLRHLSDYTSEFTHVSSGFDKTTLNNKDFSHTQKMKVGWFSNTLHYQIDCNFPINFAFVLSQKLVCRALLQL